ncbi:SRPBCC domain-containing protein [Cryomorpha ignava]|uniref:SRPBCC domain-containing protein n=1 Tax=Cryomorpha ignava TaxID=101383 RepID=A0A7K3WUI0_9FLAO|nr:START-like domain-containing protein [Cryomorpha ignava]NEN25333.1 SRPBCC domain-containing protein [Cryomorpha ignava]
MSERQKVEIEFLLKTSPKILYNMISTPSGLSDWFADNVNVRDEVFTFFWDGSEEKAKLLSKTKDQAVKFQWDYDEGEDVYFEFRIKIDAMTREVALIITDFPDEGDEESNRSLWESQLEDLKRVLGA